MILKIIPIWFIIYSIRNMYCVCFSFVFTIIRIYFSADFCIFCPIQDKCIINKSHNFSYHS